MPNLQLAYQYVIDACNYPYVGYNWNWPERASIDLTVTYRTYCDCSSLMSKAMTVGGYFTNNPWFWTGNQIHYMQEAGWVQQPLSGVWLPGDILHHYGDPGHTEMVYTGGDASGVTMGAHSSRYDFPLQVSINDYTSRAAGSSWTSLWRDPTGTAAAYKWYQSNTVLDDYGDYMTGNAFMVWQYFSALGFTAEAIAGLLGNMQQESGINPGRWQGGSGPGYGLVQWDPASGYFNYATRNGIDINDADSNGNGQCQCINDGESEGQWLPNHPTAIAHNTRYSWAEFSQLTDVNEAVRAFLYEYERAGTPMLENRYTYAAHWYDIIKSGIWGAADIGTPSARPGVQRNGAIAELQRRLVIPGRL